MPVFLLRLPSGIRLTHLVIPNRADLFPMKSLMLILTGAIESGRLICLLLVEAYLSVPNLDLGGLSMLCPGSISWGVISGMRRLSQSFSHRFVDLILRYAVECFYIWLKDRVETLAPSAFGRSSIERAQY